MAKFDDCIGYVLQNEGGYTNDPNDHGGATNFGITAPDVAKFRRVPLSSITNTMMFHLSKVEAEAIYMSQYWNPLKLDQVADHGKAVCIFDTGVNRGISVGAKYAQRVCNLLGGALVVDGDIGLHTLAAINQSDRKAFIKTYESLVQAAYDAIIAHNPSQEVFRRGWMARARRLLSLI